MSGGSLSNIGLLDVFHHLARPLAFLTEASRVLKRGGRVILFEPYISWASVMAYGLIHHEPVAWRKPIDWSVSPPISPAYYAAQGNATRIFFGAAPALPGGLRLALARADSNFAYLLSGGLSKPALYPERAYPALRSLDRALSFLPRLFGARCLVVLERQ